MVRACKRASVKLTVDFPNRWNPPFIVAKRSIEEGGIGELIHCYVRLSDSIYVPTKMLKRAYKFSVLWFLGSHAIDTLRWLAGNEVSSVYAMSRSHVLFKRGIETPDAYQAILRFRDGFIALLENSWVLPEQVLVLYDFKMELVGSKGAIYIDTSHNRCMEKYLKEGYVLPDVLGDYESYGKPMGFAIESISHFMECVVFDKEPAVTGIDGLMVTKVIEAIIESVKRDKVVNVNY